MAAAYFGGVVVLGVEPGVVELGGFTWPVEGVSTGGVAGSDGEAPVLDPVVLLVDDEGDEVADVLLDAPVEDEALGVASGAERVSEPALVVAEALVLAPVEAVWPDHQSFDIRCLGDAFI
ncbi:MAG: hypothetical protein ACHP7A_02890 [Caulobacterales bacterium]